jgi:hypothetical protein
MEMYSHYLPVRFGMIVEEVKQSGVKRLCSEYVELHILVTFHTLKCFCICSTVEGGLLSGNVALSFMRYSLKLLGTSI